jgi:serine phosphatase RsbU (regulator of sigma subunit)
MQEDKNNLYFGSYSNGISVYNKRSQTLNYLRQSENQRLDVVSAISFANKILFGTFGNGVFSVKKNQELNQKSGSELKKVELKLNDFNINCLANFGNKYLLVGTEKGGVNVFDNKDTLVSILNKNSTKNSISNSYVVCILVDRNNLVWLGTAGDGIDIILNFNDYVTGKDKNLRIVNLSTKQKIANNTVLGIIQDKRGNYWISTSNGLTRLISNTSLKLNTDVSSMSNNQFYNAINVKNYDVNEGIPSNDFNTGAFAGTKNDELFFGTSNGIFSFFPDSIKESDFIAPVVFTKFKIFENDSELDTSITYKKQLNLTYKESFFSFEFAALNFNGGESDQYSYMMEGFDEDWINSGTRRFASYTNLDPKEYIFKVRIANEEGGWNPTGASIKIIITPPWYKTKLAYLFFVVIIIALFYFYIKWREVRLKTEKKILENKVEERTKEIAIINVEISKKNEDITDSINYAKRIQQAILPPIEELQENFKDSFILYKPKDIVSGDFYWLFKSEFDNQEKQILIAAADCTGHGVPGAFMSMVSIDKLNEAVKYHFEPSKILEYINVGIKSALRQSSEMEGQTRDGLDIALVRVIKLPESSFELSFSGANRPLWILRENATEIEEIKATKAAIGGFTSDKQEFTQNRIVLKSGDAFYLFSDGYPDQFGGEFNKKFMTKKLKDLIVQNKNKTMFQQKIIFDTVLKNWQGNYQQIDDILVIGVRLLY